MVDVTEIKKLQLARVFKKFALRHNDGSLIVVRDRGSIEYPADESKLAIVHGGFEGGELAEIVALADLTEVLPDPPDFPDPGKRSRKKPKPGEYRLDDVRQWYYAKPFHPFRIRLQDGSSIDVLREFSIMLLPDETLRVSDRSYPVVAMEEVAGIEFLNSTGEHRASKVS